MELKILSNNENRLLNRKEIEFSVDQESSTANRTDLTKELCKKLNLSPESTLIVRIDQGFGKKESRGMAHSYQTKEALERYEPKHILERISKKAGKKAAAEEKPAE